MTFRARLLTGAVLVAILPLLAVALLVRGQMRAVVTELEVSRGAQSAARVTDAFAGVVADLDRRTRGLVEQLERANGVRLALLGQAPRFILVEWPANVLSGTGMDVFWLQNADGVVLAAAGAALDTGVVMPGWTDLDPGAPAVADLPRADGGVRVLAMRYAVQLDGRTVHVVAGRALDPVLNSLGRGPVAVAFGEGHADTAAADLVLPLYRLGAWSNGTLVIERDTGTLTAALARLDRSFLLVGGGAAILALLASLLLARSVSRPLERLAEQTGRLDLERLEIDVHPGRQDEIGQLERTLAALAARLKASVATLREAERRATVGDIARQVNHDIKNGLVPIRNVLRHLVETAAREPERTAAILEERRGTLEASVTYLEQLAANYARLSPAVTGGRADLGEIVRAAVDAARRDGLALHTDVRGTVMVGGDPVAVRRVVENLVGNARDAARGVVRVACAGGDGTVTLDVTDDGPGMTAEQLDRAFAGFHTTKPFGTGLGLTVVRRLVQDLGGSLKVETEPERGTTVRVEFPAA